MQLGTGWAVMPGVSQHVGMDPCSTPTHEFGHMLGVTHDVMGSNLAPGQPFSPSFATPLWTSFGPLTSHVTGPAAHVARLESVSVEIEAEMPDRVGVMLPEIVENA